MRTEKSGVHGFEQAVVDLEEFTDALMVDRRE